MTVRDIYQVTEETQCFLLVDHKNDDLYLGTLAYCPTKLLEHLVFKMWLMESIIVLQLAL